MHVHAHHRHHAAVQAAARAHAVVVPHRLSYICLFKHLVELYR